MGLTKGNNMANFGTYFLKNFSPNFTNTFNTSYRYGLSKQEEERKKREELKAQQEQQGILSQLSSGMNSQIVPPKMNAQGTGFDVQPQGLNQQQLTNLIGSASDDTLQRYKLLRELNAPKEKKYSPPILKKDKPTIWQWNETDKKLEDTGQPNPFYEEQLLEGSEFVPATSIKGLEKWKGYTVERKVWTDKDGNIVKYGGVGNPIKPTYKEHKDKKVYSLSNYKEKTGVFAKREADLNSKITKYKLENIIDIDAYNKGEEKIGTYGNAINKAYDKEEIAFYNDMIPDARNYVNKHFYQPLKESGVPEESVYSDRQGIYQDYVADLIDNYKEGNIDIDLNNYEIPEGVDPATFAKDVEAEVFKSALLWGKLKLRRL